MTMFSQDALAKIVADTLPPSTDQTHTNAVIGIIDQRGVQVVASFSRPKGSAVWTLQAAAKHDWTGDNEVGAKVILKW